ncbi:MAG TPA: valine--tRNA ligase, partial [Actinomycetota bacterium]|nr:valine--tRNA ligase [Actinomycetota bacterium]
VETMLGDTGVAVHPDDDRYRDLLGRTVRHPFTGEDLPIVEDAVVDPAFGTGAVKVTPAHDPTDFDIAERTGLPAKNILTADARISDEAPEAFRGLDRYDARRAVLEALRDRGLVVAEERPYEHPVGHCYRCGSEIEPWLSGKQWFVAVDRLKGPARDAAADGRIRFFPERWVGPYTTWLENLRDWNISRQLWWGHRIPVWYCSNGHEFAAVDDPNACAECGTSDIEQDPDVLDTWFSSQLWPFSTLGWPDETPDLRFFYPTSVLVTGYEILYLWVARMIMSGMYLVGDVPFEHVLIHGLVRDERNRKMSKSLGNVIDPLEMIDRYGADALRFALARMAGPEQQNIPFGERDVEAARHFANKLWNAGRLVLSAAPEDEGASLVEAMATAGDIPASYQDRVASESYVGSDLTARWILSRHEACRTEVDAALEEYRFSDAALALHRFLWSELADWGLEMSKPALYERGAEQAAAAWRVLAWVLERTLRLLHPIMPFVTEELWQRFGAGDSIVVAEWPEPHPEHRDEEAEGRFALAMDVVSALRSFRSDHGIPPATGITARVWVPEAGRRVLAELEHEIRRLARLDALELPAERPDPSGSARLVVGAAEILLPLAGVLDRDTECARIRGRLEALAQAGERSERKLANEGFLAKAPAEVVEGERRKLSSIKEERGALEAQLAELGC